MKDSFDEAVDNQPSVDLDQVGKSAKKFFGILTFRYLLHILKNPEKKLSHFILFLVNRLENHHAFRTLLIYWLRYFFPNELVNQETESHIFQIQMKNNKVYQKALQFPIGFKIQIGMIIRMKFGEEIVCLRVQTILAEEHEGTFVVKYHLSSGANIELSDSNSNYEEYGWKIVS